MQKPHLYGLGTIVVVAGVLMGFKSPLLAQVGNSIGRPHPPRLDGPSLDDMTQMLGLSAAQQQKIKVILDASQQQINAALTPQQRSQWQEFQAHHGPSPAPVGQRGEASAPLQPPSQSNRAQPPRDASTTRVQVVFAGGYETDPRDNGRPVVLIAGALGVQPQVFRDAFSGVHPARNGGPTEEEAQRNKRVLLDALGPYGITNERLDEVSNYYRYMRSRGEMWTNQPAEAYALIKNGKVTGVEIINAGAGYSSLPTVTVPGLTGVISKVQIVYGSDLARNGSIGSITVSP